MLQGTSFPEEHQQRGAHQGFKVLTVRMQKRDVYSVHSHLSSFHLSVFIAVASSDSLPGAISATLRGRASEREGAREKESVRTFVKVDM